MKDKNTIINKNNDNDIQNSKLLNNHFTSDI